MKASKRMIMVFLTTIIIILSLPCPAMAEDYLTINLLSKSGLRGEDIDKVFAGCPLCGLGNKFVQVEESTGVNAQFLASLAIHESGWGRSRIARDKNNIFGYGACDRAPYRLAKTFSSREECIELVAWEIKKDFLTPGGRCYSGQNLQDVNKRYCSKPSWAGSIAAHMKRFDPYLPQQPINPIPLVRKKEEEKLKKPQLEEVGEMQMVKMDSPTAWVGLAILTIVFMIRRKSAILLILTSLLISPVKMVGYILKEALIAAALAVRPAIGVLWNTLIEDFKEAIELFKIKRHFKKMSKQARGAKLAKAKA